MTKTLIPTARLTSDGGRTRIVLDADGQRLAFAAVAVSDRGVRLHFDVSRGHLPVTARRELVDAVFALPQVAGGIVVHAALPLGDAELLSLLRTHLNDVRTHAAGATCLLEATGPAACT